MKYLARLIMAITMLNAFAFTADASEKNKSPQPPVDAQAMKDWQAMKFGMFVHWGLYSKTAGYWKGQRTKNSGHIMLYEKIPVKEWGELAGDFNPTAFDADAWVLAAKDAGMQYFVITTKHHDGLAMYNSPSSDYDITDKSPFKRDPIKELADACHKHGVRLGFYYSLGRDWEDPDAKTDWPKKGGRSNTWDYPDENAKVVSRYFKRKVKPQIEELVTQYGEVNILWFDMPELISRKESLELRELILTHQPKCIINDRIGNGLGDYMTREQKIGGIDLSPWESCITMAKHWNYDLDETDQYKSPEVMVNQLLEIVSKGGNYLLNNGPRADGTMTEATLSRLKTIGKWMNVNGEGIYGTRPWTIDRETLAKTEARFTVKGNDLYAFISQRSQEDTLIRSLATGKVAVADITLLGSDHKPKWRQSEDGLMIEMPDYGGTPDIPIRCLKISLK